MIDDLVDSRKKVSARFVEPWYAYIETGYPRELVEFFGSAYGKRKPKLTVITNDDK